MTIRESRRFHSIRERIAASPDAILLLVVLVIFMDMTIYGILIPVFPEYASQLGVDESAFGIVFGVYAAMLLLFSIPMGLLSDRVGRRPLIAAGMLLLAGATALFGFSTTVVHLCIARTIQGISAAATWSAGLALLADITDPSKLGERMGIALSAVGLGTLFGPVAGGLLFECLGHVATFLIPAVVVAALGMVVLAVPLPSCRRKNQERAGMIPAGSLFSLAACGATVVAVSGTYGILDPYLPVYLHARFSSSPSTIGLVFAVLAIAAAIAQPVAGRIYDRCGGSRYLIGFGLLFSGVAIVAAVHAPTLPLIVAAILALGMTLGSALVPVMPVMAGIYRAQGSQGVAYGIYNTFYSIGLALGPFAGAALLSHCPLSAIFLLQGLVLGVVGMFGCFLIGRLGWR